MASTRTFAPLMIAGLTLGACSGDLSGPAGGGQSQIRLSLASRSAAAPSGRTASFSVVSPTPGTFSDGTNTLVLTKAQLVLRKVELKRANAALGVCADVQVSATGSGSGEPGDDEGHDGVADSCEEVELGPVLFEVPVASAGAKQSLSVTVDSGTYGAVEFKIHPAEPPDDQAFLQANPTFAGKSIHVEGTWNGTSFNFDSDITAEEELALQPPIAVAASGAAEVTIFVDVSGWFANGSAGLVDPSTANKGQPNEGLVSDNIQHSFRAFEDENEDGQDDHGSH